MAAQNVCLLILVVYSCDLFLGRLTQYTMKRCDQTIDTISDHCMYISQFTRSTGHHGRSWRTRSRPSNPRPMRSPRTGAHQAAADTVWVGAPRAGETAPSLEVPVLLFLLLSRDNYGGVNIGNGSHDGTLKPVSITKVHRDHDDPGFVI